MVLASSRCKVPCLCSVYWLILLIYTKFALNLSLFANCRSQFLLDRLGRCLKQIVSSESISCHEFASQFGLKFVLYAKKNPNLSLIQSRPHVVYFNGSPTGHCLASVESGAPNHDGLIVRTDISNSEGRGGGVGVCVFASVGVCARACVRACVRARCV